MRNPLLVSESTLTERYQTTIPDQVRKVLGLKKREKIRFTIQADGQVMLSRADEEDPAIDQFLSFLAQDIKSNPQRLGLVDSDLAGRIQSLVSGVEIDLDAPLSDADE